MAKPGSAKFSEAQTWGTWDELLLACAVHRYGADSWDSVAVEVQKRTTSLKSLTGHSCKLKYHDLKRRFSHDDAALPKPDSNDDGVTTANTNIPWLEELRKLRVAELKSELERYDLSIVSLQLKVKRLKEEREDCESDPEKKDTEKRKDGEPDSVIGGEDSDRFSRSVNESNSTDPKAESPGAADKLPEPVEPGNNEADRSCEEEVRVEDSCDSAGEEPERVADGDSGKWKEESGSDMQSSASLSAKVTKVKEAEEPEGNESEQEQTPAIKSVMVESQPLVDFLEILRSHKLGSLLGRRLETQETPEYASLIRQHIDLETIRTRLEAGWYLGCHKSFFRDLLLLFNNAIVFFGKNTSVSAGAMELIQLVSKEMANTVSLPDLLPLEQSSVPEDPELPLSVATIKPRMRVLTIACRKRSSIATKASSLFSGADKKGEQNSNSVEEKPVTDLKQHDSKSSDEVEENRTAKKKTEERSDVGAKSPNKSRKGRTAGTTKANKNSDSNSNSGVSGKAGSQGENVESKIAKDRKGRTNGSSKKKDVANFLDRIKQGSASNNGSLLESLKQPGLAPDSSKLSQQSRSTNRKSGVEKVQNSKKASVGKRERENPSSGKKNVGRPPRRATVPPVSPAVPTSRRRRESVGADASGQARKRSRR